MKVEYQGLNMLLQGSGVERLEAMPSISSFNPLAPRPDNPKLGL